MQLLRPILKPPDECCHLDREHAYEILADSFMLVARPGNDLMPMSSSSLHWHILLQSSWLIAYQPGLSFAIERVQGRVMALQDVWIRPTLVSKGRKMTGTLEAHQNGFRYSSPKGETLDVMYRWALCSHGRQHLAYALWHGPLAQCCNCLMDSCKALVHRIPECFLKIQGGLQTKQSILMSLMRASIWHYMIMI